MVVRVGVRCYPMIRLLKSSSQTQSRQHQPRSDGAFNTRSPINPSSNNATKIICSKPPFFFQTRYKQRHKQQQQCQRQQYHYCHHSKQQRHQRHYTRTTITTPRPHTLRPTPTNTNAPTIILRSAHRHICPYLCPPDAQHIRHLHTLPPAVLLPSSSCTTTTTTAATTVGIRSARRTSVRSGRRCYDARVGCAEHAGGRAGPVYAARGGRG